MIRGWKGAALEPEEEVFDMAQDNATIARRLYEDWNNRDFEHLASMCAEDCEITLVGSGTRFTGPTGAKEFAHMWADAFPDGRVTIDTVIADGDNVAAKFTGAGTHTGPLATPSGDIPATGRSITLHLFDFMKIRDGKISKVESYFDSASLLMQLGVTPEVRVSNPA
jgi:steroid delta-isomerase-like uncharacterized protein